MDSEIAYNKETGDAVVFSGEDAVHLYRARLLWSSIKMYKNTGGKIIPTRGFGITKMLDAASYYTKKKYKRTQLDSVIHDLDVFCKELQAALPSREV